MRVLNVVDVNEAYFLGFQVFGGTGGDWDVQSSRVGKVRVLDEPLAVTYEKPLRRVLFDPGRDSNPFFSLFESLWMLAGGNDARWLDRFIHDFSSRFAEEGGRMHGAYGFRWRHHFDLDGGGAPGLPDQLDVAIRLLRKNPLDRRVVISMWDPVADLGADVRDVPCNLIATPRIVDGKLDLTVFCRSGDFIWGTTGANAVHFSFLQEYLAGRIGVGVGKFCHIINNPHAYEEVYSKLPPPVPFAYDDYPDTYKIGHDWDAWDADLHNFMAWTLTLDPQEPDAGPFPHYPANPWFEDTAGNLFVIHALWKKGERERALALIDDPSCHIAPDWKRACREWMQRRVKRAADKVLEGKYASANSRQEGGLHYKVASYQHWDFVVKVGLNYLEGNTTKYVTRARRKGGIEDLRKALHYLDKIAEQPGPTPPRPHITVPLAKEITEFAAANQLTDLERAYVWQIAFWQTPEDLKLARETLQAIIDATPVPPAKPVPLTEENHYAERAR